MQINTSRFGHVRIERDDILLFPHGLIGFESQRHWVLLQDTENEAVAWLQSTTDTQTAVAVVSPRRYAPDYRLRIDRQQLATLQLGELDRTFVLCAVARNGESLTANLRAPIVINLDRRLGRQVVSVDEQPLQWELPVEVQLLRKSA